MPIILPAERQCGRNNKLEQSFLEKFSRRVSIDNGLPAGGWRPAQRIVCLKTSIARQLITVVMLHWARVRDEGSSFDIRSLAAAYNPADISATSLPPPRGHAQSEHL